MLYTIVLLVLWLQGLVKATNLGRFDRPAASTLEHSALSAHVSDRGAHHGRLCDLWLGPDSLRQALSACVVTTVLMLALLLGGLVAVALNSAGQPAGPLGLDIWTLRWASWDAKPCLGAELLLGVTPAPWRELVQVPGHS